MNRKSLVTMSTSLLCLFILVTGIASASPGMRSASQYPGSSGTDDAPLAPTGTGFTYQGHLLDGSNPANGQYDLRFTLFDALSGGLQVGSPITITNQTVSDGLFTVTLDFGTAAFQGEARFMRIEIKPAGGPTYTPLAPRQALTAAPYALSLRPGATIRETSASNMLLVSNQGSGTGLSGFSQSGTGVVGNSGTGSGVFGSTTSDDPAINGINLGTGSGLEGASLGGPGVRGMSSTGTAVEGESSGGIGVFGVSNTSSGVGVYGESGTGPLGVGVRGTSASGIAVYGTASTGVGVQGGASVGIGVRGASNGSGSIAVRGEALGSDAYGVYGTSPLGYGGYFTSTSGTGLVAEGGNGIYGTGIANNGIGLWGVSGIGSGARGVYGTSVNGVGVYGTSTNDIGVFGSSTDDIGVKGTTTDGVAIEAEGNGPGTTALKITDGAFQITDAGNNTSTAAFKHTYNNPSNTCADGNATILDNPYLNGKPNAIPIITYNATNTGSFSDFPVVGVAYGNTGGVPPCPANRWVIYNTDELPNGIQFNVLVITP